MQHELLRIHVFVGEGGDGTTTFSATPVAVKSLAGPATRVVASEFSCALLSNGQVQCWGIGSAGRLGNGGVADSTVPVDVLTLAP